MRLLRKDQESIATTGGNPSFSKLVDFVAKGDSIACNQVSSLDFALNDTCMRPAKHHRKSSCVVNVLATASTNQQKVIGIDTRPHLCEYCKIRKVQQLFKCEIFDALSMIDKQDERTQEKPLF